MAGIQGLPGRAIKQRRFVLGLDYGTTYTGVAYGTPESHQLPVEEIDLVENWGTNMGNAKKIPSVISFSPPTEAMEQQWGFDLSLDAVRMVNTKLELEHQSVLSELDLLVQALNGMRNLRFETLKHVGQQPAYTDKSAEDIVAKYLEMVFNCLLQAIKPMKELMDTVPVDIVITVPTDWSYAAKNSTYRAVTNAGFRKENFPRLTDVIFVTEAEAAAVYTARYLKEQSGVEFLKPGECFILCDAGGGTVDVVSYKVLRVDPAVELERIGIPTGDKCGSTQIDSAFKNWLRGLLGDKHYQKLDDTSDLERVTSHTTEGRAMRELMSGFYELKYIFHKEQRDMRLDLPAPLQNLNLDNRINGGEFIISNKIMTGFFQECVHKIVELIEGHVRQIGAIKKVPKNVFLVGGFAESAYLQEEIELSLRLRNIKLRRPDTSWTAVVRGAVLCGVEKETTSSLSRAMPCPRDYGISDGAQYLKENDDCISLLSAHQDGEHGQMVWLLNKGDLILSDELAPVVHRIPLSFREKDEKRRKLVIYYYSGDDNRPSTIENSMDDLNVSHELEYDLNNIPIKELRKFKTKHGLFYTTTLTLILTLFTEGLRSVLSWNGIDVATGSEFW